MLLSLSPPLFFAMPPTLCKTLPFVYLSSFPFSHLSLFLSFTPSQSPIFHVSVPFGECRLSSSICFFLALCCSASFHVVYLPLLILPFLYLSEFLPCFSILYSPLPLVSFLCVPQPLSLHFFYLLQIAFSLTFPFLPLSSTFFHSCLESCTANGHLSLLPLFSPSTLFLDYQATLLPHLIPCSIFSNSFPVCLPILPPPPPILPSSPSSRAKQLRGRMLDGRGPLTSELQSPLSPFFFSEAIPEHMLCSALFSARVTAH